MHGVSVPGPSLLVPDVSGGDVARAGVRTNRTPPAPLPATDTDELVEASRRILAALSRRVGGGDIEDLRRLIMLRQDLEICIINSIAGLRADPDLPASWADIGRALGITRHAACERYSGVKGLRRPGGQPGNWR
jgi:hypothetical protein